MGNRMLKESIRMSGEIDQLSWFEEAMFYRLIVTVDDYGIYSANPVTLSHILFPMKENVTSGMIKDALSHFVELGLIDVYEVDGKGIFLNLVSWGNHQRLHESKHKFPTPEEGRNVNGEIINGDFPKISASFGENKNVSEKNRLKPSRNQGEEKRTSSCTEETEISSMPPVIEISLNDGSMYGVSQEDVDKYQKLYPAVDVMQELRAMVGWSYANPKNRKTRTGITRFINSWLARAQNQGGRGYYAGQNKTRNGNVFADMARSGE